MLKITKIFILIVNIIILCSCSNSPKSIPLKTTIQAVYYLNPNIYNRPSPVVVTIYQLKDNISFKDADFFSLYNRASITLGNNLIDKKQLEIRPNQKKILNLKLSTKVHYLGIIAAYHNTTKTEWRKSITIPPNSKAINFNIELQSQGINVTQIKQAKFCFNSTNCFF